MIQTITTNEFLELDPIDKDLESPVFFDIETEELYYNCSLMQLRQNGISYLVRTQTDEEVERMKAYIKPLFLVGWNLSYDFGTLNMVSDKVADEFYATKITYPQFQEFSLDKVVAKRGLGYLYEGIDKKDLQKKGFMRTSYLSQAQLRYANSDVEALELMWADPKLQAVIQTNLAYKLAIYALIEAMVWQNNGLPVIQETLTKYLADARSRDVDYSRQLEELAGIPLNPRSSKQVKEYLGTGSSDKATLTRIAIEGKLTEAKEYSAKVRVKAREAQDFTEVQQAVAELVLLARKAKNDISKLEGYVGNDKMYGRFNPIGTSTSRWSCFPASTLISVPGHRVTLEDICVGDEIFTMTDEMELTTTRVKEKFYQGERETIKLEWRALSNKRMGTLECTPDHLVRTMTGKWIEAKDALGIRLSYLSKSTSIDERGADRFLLYSNASNVSKDLPEVAILKDVRGIPRSRHAHHKDRDTLNNHESNIEYLTRGEHLKEHRSEFKLVGLKGSDNPAWNKRGKLSYVKELFRKKGKIGSISNTINRKYPELQEIARLMRLRFDLDGNWITLNRIRKAHYANDTIAGVIRELNLSKNGDGRVSSASRLKANSLLILAGCENHQVIGISKGTLQSVYDIGLEEHFNFYAEEINVHNCKGTTKGSSRPELFNAQNYSRDFKAVFGVAEDSGMIIVAADYATLEIRIAACMMKEPNMYQALLDGVDIHKATASMLFDKPVEDVHGKERSNAKVA